MKRALLASVLIGCAPLVACATLGTHVKGNFACQAPGGTCAPTSAIDDQALRQLVGDPGGVAPAGPYTAPDAPRPQVAAARAGAEKVLRVVFPAYTDREGRLHEASAIHAVVRVPYPSRLEADTSVAYHGQSLGELASAAPEMAFPAPTGASETTSSAPVGSAANAASDYPSKQAIEAARANARPVALVAPTSGSRTGAVAAVAVPRTEAPAQPGAPAHVAPGAPSAPARIAPGAPLNKPSVMQIGSLTQ